MSLKTSVLAIGYIKLTIYTLSLIGGLCLATGVYSLGNNNNDYNKINEFFQLAGKIIAVISAINLFFSGFLVSGAHKGNTAHLNVYIIFTYIVLGFAALGFLMDPVANIKLLPPIIVETGCLAVVVIYKNEMMKKLQGSVIDLKV